MLSERERMMCAILDCAIYIILADSTEDVRHWLEEFRVTNCKSISKFELSNMMDDVYKEIMNNSRIVQWAIKRKIESSLEDLR
jgi:hypothetical protein